MDAVPSEDYHRNSAPADALRQAWEMRRAPNNASA